MHVELGAAECQLAIQSPQSFVRPASPSTAIPTEAEYVLVNWALRDRPLTAIGEHERDIVFGPDLEDDGIHAFLASRAVGIIGLYLHPIRPPAELLTGEAFVEPSVKILTRNLSRKT